MTQPLLQSSAPNDGSRILIAGGAGYIGSHMSRMLQIAGYNTATIDNLSSGHRSAITGDFIQGDIGDRKILDSILTRTPVDAIMIFAGSIQVGESVIDPALYYRNNVSNVLCLLDAAMAYGIRRIVFSSSAAIFGEPSHPTLDEYHPCQPLNPYGRSKLMIEEILSDYDRAYGIKSVCLRYFNAAGAWPDQNLGERHEPETHLIPITLQVAQGLRPEVSVFGNDYDTPDGTCIRDYVHVLDICQAHLLALKWLQTQETSLRINLGNGKGFSVKEVIEAAQRVTGKTINIKTCPRRPGDPARLISDSKQAETTLGWQPQFTDLDQIIGSAWAYAQARA